MPDLTKLSSIPRGYAAILFVDSQFLGWAIAITTMFFPNIGFAGLTSTMVAYTTNRLLRLPDYAGNIHLYNSLLVGLSLGAFYQFSLHLAALIVIGAILTVFVCVILADSLWRYDRLPVLSLPFLIVASIMSIVARQHAHLDNIVASIQSKSLYLPTFIDTFLATLGAIFFIPTPIIGILIFFGILFISRYLCMLAIGGFLIGYFIFKFLDYAPHPSFLTWTGFNFMLTAMALGGIYTIPSFSGLILAIVGVFLCAIFIIATQNFLLIDGLPVMAFSFVITTLILLIAMRKRTHILPPTLAAEPGLPETNYERARLAKIRNGDLNSVPLLTPFFGCWHVYQGFFGPHTHKSPWQYALDFFILESGSSFMNNGSDLKDYYCFELPVVSPAHGDVVRIYDHYPDNLPGEVDLKHGWGNFVLIRLDSGLHVLLAHLRQHSIKIKEGDRVLPGTVLAACGNSGRSPQPHLHMQVQKDADLGSDTCAFHLCSVLHQSHNGVSEYKVVSIPKQGDSIKATVEDKLLSMNLHLPVGRKLTYQMQSKGSETSTLYHLQVELSLLGQFFLTCNSRAKTAFEEINGVLAYYDRSGVKNRFLDMWILAMGLTPLTTSASQWLDSPSAKLMPLSTLQRMWLGLIRPLGCGIKSHYTREWKSNSAHWMQTGKHTLKVVGINMQVSTCAILDTELGCRELTISYQNRTWQANLLESGLRPDEGIPGWTYDHPKLENVTDQIRTTKPQD